MRPPGCRGSPTSTSRAAACAPPAAPALTADTVARLAAALEPWPRSECAGALREELAAWVDRVRGPEDDREVRIRQFARVGRAIAVLLAPLRGH